jgi:predicted metal-binding protein
VQTNRLAVISEFDALPALASQESDAVFKEYTATYAPKLVALITSLKTNARPLQQFPMRLGLVFPLAVVIDERVKELCRLPYPRRDGRVAPCGGITNQRKACPPYSPAVADTVKLLHQAAAFLILQFENLSEAATQKYIHNFTVRVEKELISAGLTVLGTYCCGPCRICLEGCSDDECRHPAARKFALESCGFWVNQLCKLAQDHTIHGDTRWEIEWVKDYGLATQLPQTFKSMSGILLK